MRAEAFERGEEKVKTIVLAVLLALMFAATETTAATKVQPALQVQVVQETTKPLPQIVNLAIVPQQFMTVAIATAPIKAAMPAVQQTTQTTSQPPLKVKAAFEKK